MKIMNKKKYVKSLFIRVLISIVLFLIVGISINRSDKFLLFYKNNVYDKNLNFSKISNFINKHFGKTFYVDENVTSVNKEIKYTSFNTYKDGAVLNDINSVYPFKSGIVVFIGEKEDYGNTIIIQGMDGVDYWYSNITDIGVKLYDYVEDKNIIGHAKDNKLYVLFMKDNKFLDYNDYL